VVLLPEISVKAAWPQGKARKHPEKMPVTQSFGQRAGAHAVATQASRSGAENPPLLGFSRSPRPVARLPHCFRAQKKSVPKLRSNGYSAVAAAWVRSSVLNITLLLLMRIGPHRPKSYCAHSMTIHVRSLDGGQDHGLIPAAASTSRSPLARPRSNVGLARRAGPGRA
jgi:hypothetical protein